MNSACHLFKEAFTNKKETPSRWDYGIVATWCRSTFEARSATRAAENTRARAAFCASPP